MSESEQSEEPPEIDDDERADVDLDALSDEIEGVDSDDEESTESDESAPETDASPAGMPDARTSIGDVYCGGLGVAAGVLVARYDEEQDRKDVSAEYEAMARDMYLDQFLNEWLREKGRPEDLPPGQAVVVGTVMFLAAVMVTNPAVGEGLMGDLKS